ncbi:hypothetical protein Leryth_016118 [Lithospermum erythrorhizon]|nr:hypothetical protein Leryth_016118 [Lithospermum erythrorhizon]
MSGEVTGRTELVDRIEDFAFLDGLKTLKLALSEKNDQIRTLELETITFQGLARRNCAVGPHPDSNRSAELLRVGLWLPSRFLGFGWQIEARHGLSDSTQRPLRMWLEDDRAHGYDRA